MKNRFFTKQNIRTGASLNLNSNMKTKTHIQFFSSNFDVLLEQNNPDLAVPFSSKQTSHIVSTITTTTTKQGCSRPDQIFIMIWKLFENYLKIVNHGENLFESQCAVIYSYKLEPFIFYDVMTTLKIVFIQDEWFMINLQILVGWPTDLPTPHLKIAVLSVLGT